MAHLLVNVVSPKFLQLGSYDCHDFARVHLHNTSNIFQHKDTRPLGRDGGDHMEEDSTARWILFGPRLRKPPITNTLTGADRSHTDHVDKSIHKSMHMFTQQ